MEREIIGEIIQTGGQQQDLSVADFFLQKYRGLIGEASYDTGIARIHTHGKIKLYSAPALGLFHSRISGVRVSDREVALAISRIVQG